MLRRVLHEVAQPLTVLEMLLGEVTAGSDPAQQGDLLTVAKHECHRVVTAVRNAQAASAAMAVARETSREALR